jgi:N-acetylglucosamine malate deacetylase 1
MKVLVVAAHPDDEVLGCGGTIAKHTSQGDQVTSLFLADGVGARGTDNRDALAERMAAAAAAAEILGCESPRHENLPDNQLDTLPLLELAQAVERAVEDLQPDRIYTHHRGDLNVDHQLTHDSVLTACRPLPGRSVTSIYAFETLSSTEWSGPYSDRVFLPNHFENIDGFLDKKLAALGAYDAEMAAFPHPRSPEAVRALAILRGAHSGFHAAEAFMLLRSLN